MAQWRSGGAERSGSLGGVRSQPDRYGGGDIRRNLSHKAHRLRVIGRLIRCQRGLFARNGNGDQMVGNATKVTANTNNSTVVGSSIAPVALAASAASAAASSAANPTIKYRHVGKTGLKISNLGLGGIKLFNSENPEVAEDVVAEAVEKGINFFDVSEPYNPDRSEQEFGRIFRKLGLERRNVQVCTKVYWDSK